MKDDIDRHVSEKFQTWLNDSIELYKLADLSPRDCVSSIIHCLIYGMAITVRYFDVDIDPKVIHSMLDEAIEEVTEAQKKHGH